MPLLGNRRRAAFGDRPDVLSGGDDAAALRALGRLAAGRLGGAGARGQPLLLVVVVALRLEAVVEREDGLLRLLVHVDPVVDDAVDAELLKVLNRLLLAVL